MWMTAADQRFAVKPPPPSLDKKQLSLSRKKG
jgi:hypothetical protein